MLLTGFGGALQVLGWFRVLDLRAFCVCLIVCGLVVYLGLVAFVVGLVFVIGCLAR